ncbi:MAG TPA: ABC transporter ATP-binding protein [Thermoplasmata archaeon]|nr:ABC transporter ATP-binding protein [Thermoplasmata archaeon]
MIEAESLTRRFGDLTAVDALTFRVDSGEIFGFLGPNGAGKTTTVRMLTCLIAKTSGTARVGGHEIGDPRAAMAIRRMVGVVPDNVGLYEDLSAYRNLDFYGRLYDIADGPRREAIERLLRLLGVWERRDSVVGTFSKGMKQKLAIARALVHDPSVLFLDEPTANLDPEAAKTVRDFILQLSTEGKTILLNTHNLTEAQRLCDRIGILNTRLVTVGTPAELEASVGKPKVVIELEEVTDAILQAIQRVVPGPVVRAGTQLTVDVSDAGKENPALAAAIVGAGGRIKQISTVNPTLEDVYLTFVHKGHP